MTQTHRAYLPFGNPFKMLLPKGSSLSPKLNALLNTFEESIAERLTSLKPGDKEDILSLSWVGRAMSTVCEIHTDVQTLITDLELPIADWDTKWMDVYLDKGMGMLDIGINFKAEILRLSRGRYYLFGLNKLDGTAPQLIKARSSLDEWKQHMHSKSPRVENCFAILDSLIESLCLPKIKNSPKGKVLMRALYGVRVATVFIFSIFAVAFSGSANKLKGVQVIETCLWARAFVDLRDFISGEIRSIYSKGRFTTLKDIEAVDTSVKNLYSFIQVGTESVDVEKLNLLTSDLAKEDLKLSEGLEHLGKENDRFFQILMRGRNVLMGNFKVANGINTPADVNRAYGANTVKEA